MPPQDVYTSGVQRTRHRKPRPSTDLELTYNLLARIIFYSPTLNQLWKMNQKLSARLYDCYTMWKSKQVRSAFVVSAKYQHTAWFNLHNNKLVIKVNKKAHGFQILHFLLFPNNITLERHLEWIYCKPIKVVNSAVVFLMKWQPPY